jgi:hypothetical protein
MLPEDRVNLARPKSESDRKMIADVREHGVHVVHVFDPEGKDPEFSYTLGLWHTYRHPEVLIFGLKRELRHTLLNNLKFAISNGRSFTDGLSANDALAGYICYFQELSKEYLHKYLGRDCWFYDGDDFSAVQMLWPTVDGVYPWDEGASEYLQQLQPVLTKFLRRVT